MSFTTDDLILQVRRRAMFPARGGLTDAEILGFINGERRTTMAEAIVGAAPSFWRTFADFTIVAGQNQYRIPERALMQGLEKLTIVDQNGLEHPLVELDADQRWRFSTGQRDMYWPSQYAYIVDAEHVTVVPAPDSTVGGTTLRMYYHRQPSEMVMVAEAAKIHHAVDTTTVEVMEIGEDFILQTPPDDDVYLDIVRGAGMFGPIYTDLLVDELSDPQLIFDASTPIVVSEIATFAYGKRVDYACLAQQTVYTEFPLDMWPCLVTASAIACLVSTKDFAHADNMREELVRQMRSCKSLAEPRSDEPEVIINRNSVLRRSRR